MNPAFELFTRVCVLGTIIALCLIMADCVKETERIKRAQTIGAAK